MIFACPLLYLLFGAVKFVIVDLITCMYHHRSHYIRCFRKGAIYGYLRVGKDLCMQCCPLWAVEYNIHTIGHTLFCHILFLFYCQNVFNAQVLESSVCT